MMINAYDNPTRISPLEFELKYKNNNIYYPLKKVQGSKA